MTLLKKYTTFKIKEIKNKSGVYIIINNLNNKIYIGATKDIYARIKLHLSDLVNNKHTNNHLQSAWDKYGGENFEFDILEFCEEKYIYSMENYWINITGALNRKFGYNKQEGSPTKNGKWSIASRRKLSKSCTGKKRTEEQRRQMSILQKELGISPEHRLKMTEGVRRAMSIPIIMFDLENNILQRFSSAACAEREIGINATTISYNLKKHTRTCKGKVFIYEKEYNKDIDYTPREPLNQRKVYLYNRKKEYINEFSSITELCKFLNITRNSTITEKCKKNLETLNSLWYSYYFTYKKY